jgi:cell division protein FtsA
LPRVEEIFTIVAEDLQNSSFADQVAPGGVILTGGGALMRGIGEAAGELLGLQPRIGMAHPEQVCGDEKWFSPVYATAMGLLTFANSSRWGTGVSRVAPQKKSAWMRRLSGVFEDLF